MPHAFRSSWIFPLGVIFVIYAALSFYQINLPGLHYDEAFEVAPALQLLLGQPVAAFRDSALTLGQQTFPLMTQDYIGAINTYAALPFIASLGSTPAALRTMSIITGAITLGLTFAVAYRLTGKQWAGLTATLILSVDPTFIFWNRQGVFVTAVTATIGLAAVYCWLRRFQSGSTRWSAAGALLFGLGVYAKFLFLWLIAALVGAVILLNIRRLWSNRIKAINRLPIMEAFAALPAFLLGCSPLIAYNLQTGGTFLNIAQNASTSYYGVDNLAFRANLIERLSQFITVLNGTHLWYLGDIVGNVWGPVFFGAIMFFVVYLATRNQFFASNPSQTAHPFPPDKVALFPFLVIGLVILASIGTVSALWITHFAILMPWPALAVAIGGWFILESKARFGLRTSYLQKWSMLKLLLLAGLTILVITNLSSSIRYHLALTESGGLSSHSDAIYDLSDWLAQHANGPVAAMDWGLAAPVTYLTHGQVMATELFGYKWQSGIQLTERLNGFIAQPDTLYLWRAPDEIIFDRSAEFKAIYRPQNLEETIEEAFYEKSGRPILGVTRLVKKGTAGNPPK